VAVGIIHISYDDILQYYSKLIPLLHPVDGISTLFFVLFNCMASGSDKRKRKREKVGE
jgi:hypothetical protein